MTDQITWLITPQSMKTDIQATAWERAIFEVCPSADEKAVRKFTLLLSCTTGLTFDEAKARPALTRFKQFIERDAASMDASVLWAYAEAIPWALWPAWVTGFNEGQNLFDTDPAVLPTDALTPKQKEEAAQPGSPLT